MTPIILTVIIIVAAASPIRAILEVVFWILPDDGGDVLSIIYDGQVYMEYKAIQKKVEAEAPFVLM
jgi:hypothetical protein